MKIQFSDENNRYYVIDPTARKTEFHCGDCVKVTFNSMDIPPLWFRFEFEKHWYLINEENGLIMKPPFKGIKSVEL